MLIKHHSPNPLKGWQVNRESIGFLGQNLQRPECILTEPDGTVWAADARGGLVKMRHDGTQELLNPFTVENISSAQTVMNETINAIFRRRVLYQMGFVLIKTEILLSPIGVQII
jgi:hypothetical protein